MFRQKYRLQQEAAEAMEAGGTVSDLAAEDDAAAKVEAWKEGLPEAVRGWDEVKNSDTPEKFWDQMTNMRGLLGQSIRIPSEDASNEAKQEFYDKLTSKVPDLMPRPKEDDTDAMNALWKSLGRPDTADAYSVPELEVPEGVELDTSGTEVFRGIAHKYGLNQKQFEGIVKEYNQHTLQQIADQQTSFNEGVKNLKQEWGVKFDDNIAKADKVRAAFFDFIPSVNNLPADMVKSFAKLADSFGKEGSNSLTAERPEMAQRMAPAEAQALLSDILNNREHAYWQAGHPDHARAVQRVLELTKMANPGMSDDINDLRAGVSLDT